MSVYDQFKAEKATNPAPPNPPAPVLSPFVDQPATSTPQKSVYDTFKEQVKPTSASPIPGVYGQFKALQTPKDPYFYTKTDEKGGAIGKGEGVDASGRPFLGYRNPGDTATTTDKTRVATTFDPRKAQPLTKEQYYNPRADNLRNQLHDTLGIKPSEELDHAIALTVGGSNDPTNLRAIPTAENQAAGQNEGKLAQLLKDGKISYFEAQVADAKQKGVKIPWTPAQQKSGLPKLFEDTWNKVKDFFTPNVAHASVYDQFQSEKAQTPTNKFDELLKQNASISSPEFNADSLDVHDAKGNYVATFKGPTAYEQAKAKAAEINGKNETPLQKEIDQLESDRAKLNENNQDEVKSFNDRVAALNQKISTSHETPTGEATVTKSPPLGTIGRIASAVFKAGKDTLQNTSDKLYETLTAMGDSKATPTERGIKFAGTVLSTLNIPFFPLTGAIAGAKETAPGAEINGKQLPTAQSFANGVETLFKKIGEGSQTEVDTHLQFLVDNKLISQKTADEIKPIASEALTLVNTIAVGKAAHLSPKLAEDSMKLGKIIEAEWKSIPNKEGGFVSIGGKEEAPKPEEKKPETVTPDLIKGETDLTKIEGNVERYVIVKAPQLEKQYEQTYGNVYNVDNMKELIPGHRENNTITEAFHKPAAELIGKMVDKKISEPAKPGEGITIFGGATAAGKSSAIGALQESGRMKNDKVVIDGTLADTNRSAEYIRKALKNGYKVNVVYVENTPERITENLINRAQEGDRTVPFETAFNTLDKSRKNLMRLNGKFGSNQKFSVIAIDNRNEVPDFVENGIDFIRNRPYSESDIAKAKADAYAKLDQVYGKENLTERQRKEYEGFTRRKSGGSETRRAITGEESAQEHPQKEIAAKSEVIPRTGKSIFKSINDRKSNRPGSPAEYDKPEKKSTTFSEEKGGVIELQKYKNPVEEKINQLEGQVSFLEDAIKNDPARELQKYSNKNGQLPEVLGSGLGHGKFKTHGDDIVTELGFEDSETARIAFENYRLQVRRLAEYKAEVAKIKADYRDVKNTESTAKKLSVFLEKSFYKDEKNIAKNGSKLAQKPQESQQAIRQRKLAAQNNLRALVGATYKTVSPLERTTPEHILQLTEESYKMTLGEFEQMNADTSYKNVVSKFQTSVKKKVGIIDTYLRTPDRVLKKIGLPQTAALLRSSYENYLAELPLHIDLIKHWSEEIRKTSSDPEKSNVAIFDYLDGQSLRDKYSGKVRTNSLAPNELKIANEIKAYLAEWADRLGLPADSKISHYITHIFGLGENEKEFDEDLAKIITDKVTGSVYDPFLEKRLGKKGYIQNTWKALDAYVKRGVRKANMDPVLERLQAESNRMELSQARYIKRLTDNINMRPTELDTALDNTIKSFMGYKFGQRPVAYLSRLARQTIFRYTLGLNFGSAIKNLTQGVNTYAKLGEKYTAIGYLKLISEGTKELEETGVLGQDMVQDKVLSSTRKWLERGDKALFYAFELAEKINRGAAYYGAKSKALAEGKDELTAMQEAKKMVRDTQFQFGAIDTPAGLNSDIAKFFTQFLTYGLKQTEFAAEMISNKEWGGIFRYILASFAIVYVIGKDLNLKASDFIPGASFFKWGGPPALALPTEIVKASLDFPDKFGNQRSLMQKITDIGNQVPFPAGVQIKKTIRGAGLFQKTKLTDQVQQNSYNLIKGLVLGSQNIENKKAIVQKIYDNVKKLNNEGKTAEALSIVNTLSDDDYAVYEKILTSDKAKATKDAKQKLIPTFKKIQELVNTGKNQEAQDILNGLTDDEYKAYKLLLKETQP